MTLYSTHTFWHYRSRPAGGGEWEECGVPFDAPHEAKNHAQAAAGRPFNGMEYHFYCTVIFVVDENEDYEEQPMAKAVGA